jgi:hypothetical protein
MLLSIWKVAKVQEFKRHFKASQGKQRLKLNLAGLIMV